MSLDTPGYTVVRSDHPSKDKQGGICVYCKYSLLIQTLNIFIFQ